MGGYARCFLLTAFCRLLLPPGGCRGDKILVVPAKGSHWVSMDIPLKELHARGRRLTAIRSASSRYVEGSAPHDAAVDAAELTEDEVDLAFYDKLARRTLEIRRKGPVMRFLYPQAEAAFLQALGHGICAKVAAAMLEDAAASVSGLRDAGYDLGD